MGLFMEDISAIIYTKVLAIQLIYNQARQDHFQCPTLFHFPRVSDIILTDSPCKRCPTLAKVSDIRHKVSDRGYYGIVYGRHISDHIYKSTSYTIYNQARQDHFECPTLFHFSSFS
jgi:hypothetical protein